MSIWKTQTSIDKLNDGARSTLLAHLGIVFTQIDDDAITATMPVDHRHHQPIGILHGGASVALAETVGSTAGQMVLDPGYYCVGLDINANHLRAVSSGLVTAVARPIHLGRSTQVWAITIVNEDDKLVCVSRLTMSVLKM